MKKIILSFSLLLFFILGLDALIITNETNKEVIVKIYNNIRVNKNIFVEKVVKANKSIPVVMLPVTWKKALGVSVKYGDGTSRTEYKDVIGAKKIIITNKQDSKGRRIIRVYY